MTRRVVGVLAVVVSTACGAAQRPELIAQPAPAPNPTIPVAELNTPVLAPTTTTTEAPVPTTEPAPPATTSPAPAQNLREQATCGGDLPPCYVLARESGGNIHVYNYSGSGASGKWQIMPATWNNYDGYLNAADAPESVQDDKARLLWDGGRGCSHWDAC